ncbi:glycoside hydrolase family 3 N-terminal domain-containing protein [Longibacter salinarum]|nr:glycoside hydrolase family 3 N-terminal domain-containing protein [Longibacter salinarum]
MTRPFRRTFALSFSPMMFVFAVIGVSLSVLVLGCAQSQSTGPMPTVGGDGAMGSNEVSQTGQRADAEGVTMPMDRTVYLVTADEEAVTVDERSSGAFAERIMSSSADADSARVESRIDQLLSNMTLEQKVGQMTQLELGMVTRSDNFPEAIDSEKLRRVIRDHHVGSILNVVSAAYPLEHWHEIIRAIQEEAMSGELGIPVLYGIDAVHGANYTQEAVLFPQSQGMAATWNLPLAEKAAAITARDVRSSGIPWNFAPVLDVGRDPRWPRLYESPSEDPYLTSMMGLAALQGLQGTDLSSPDHVAACLKHFIGYSGSDSGRDRTPAQIPEIELRETYLPPFRDAVEAGAASIMVNSGEVSGVPVHASRYLLTDVLRDELGFEGVVVTDWLDVKKLVSLHRVAATEREATRMAIEAGIDMSMVPSDISFIEHTLDLVRSEQISEERIDASVRRILRMKLRLGLFEDPLAGMRSAENVGTQEDREVALQAARESLTLLRNRDDVLPLSDRQRVLVTGPTAHSMQSLNNGWTYTWQGGGLSQDMFHEGRPTIMEAVRERVGPDRMTYVPGATLTDAKGLDRAVVAAQESDVAVVALGEGAYAETAGNIRNLMLPDAQRTLLRRIAATGTPVVLVLAQGRPRTLGTVHEGADAILAAYNPGPEGGQAIMEVLYGDVNPSGHLPYTYPATPSGYATYDHKPSERLAEDFGMDGADPLFAFGDGMSYTSFAYSDLHVRPALIETSNLQAGEQIEVGVTIENTGDRPGKDVIQLYVTDVVATVTPAARRLKRFAKVDLAPGERRSITFTLSQDDLSFIGRDGESVVEPGEFRIQIDALNEQLRVTGQPLQLSSSE